MEPESEVSLETFRERCNILSVWVLETQDKNHLLLESKWLFEEKVASLEEKVRNLQKEIDVFNLIKSAQSLYLM